MTRGEGIQVKLLGGLCLLLLLGGFPMTGRAQVSAQPNEATRVEVAAVP